MLLGPERNKFQFKRTITNQIDDLQKSGTLFHYITETRLQPFT